MPIFLFDQFLYFCAERGEARAQGFESGINRRDVLLQSFELGRIHDGSGHLQNSGRSNLISGQREGRFWYGSSCTMNSRGGVRWGVLLLKWSRTTPCATTQASPTKISVTGKSAGTTTLTGEPTAASPVSTLMSTSIQESAEID